MLDSRRCHSHWLYWDYNVYFSQGLYKLWSYSLWYQLTAQGKGLLTLAVKAGHLWFDWPNIPVSAQALAWAWGPSAFFNEDSLDSWNIYVATKKWMNDLPQGSLTADAHPLFYSDVSSDQCGNSRQHNSYQVISEQTEWIKQLKIQKKQVTPYWRFYGPF